MFTCVEDIVKWMGANRLQLNAAKTDILWCSSQRRVDQVQVRHFSSAAALSVRHPSFETWVYGSRAVWPCPPTSPRSSPSASLRYNYVAYMTVSVVFHTTRGRPCAIAAGLLLRSPCSTSCHFLRLTHVIMTSFLVCFLYCFAFALIVTFHGAVLVACPCSCRSANNTRCAFLCPLCKLFYDFGFTYNKIRSSDDADKTRATHLEVSQGHQT